MTCNSNQSKGNFCCCKKSTLANPSLWSKKKKLEVLKNSRDCLERQIVEINEAIAELKE